MTTELLHILALVPAIVSTCCTVGRGRGSLLDLVAAIGMIAAMLDVTFSWGLLPASLWATVLIALAIVLAFAARARATGGPRESDRAPVVLATRTDTMALHSSLGLVVMAALLVTMASTPGAQPPGALPVHVHAPSLIALTAAGAAAYSLFTVVTVAHRARRCSRIESLRLVAMAVSTSLMGLSASV